MDLTIPVLVMTAIAAAAVAAYAWSETGARARRIAKRERNVPIARIEQGQRVKVTGVVHAIAPLMDSPIDREPCIGFRLVAMGLYGQGNAGHGGGGAYGSLQGSVERSGCARFAIVDDTGTAFVEGPFLVGLDLDGEWSVPNTDFSRLNRVDDYQTRSSGAWAYVYREGRLDPGDRVSVVGRASLEVDPAGARTGMRSPPVIVSVRGSADDPVIVVDAAPS
jgi:hypothetical protein